MEKSNFLYGFRLCSIRTKVIQKTNFQGQRTAGEMKIQNGPIKPKMVLFICTSFVQVCAAIFFVCATPILKLGAKTPLYRVKFQNGPIWAKVVSIVCASFVLAGYAIFFDCAQLGQKLWTKFRISRSHIQMLWAVGEMKIQNCPIEPKMMSIVCA